MEKLKSNEECRQGDLSFHNLDILPKGIKKVKHSGEFILAYGEATGHHHKIVADREAFEIYQDEKGRYILDIKKVAVLTHPEHKQITFSSGIYVQEVEVEYSPFDEELNKVKD